jgi:hypothetical protein
MASIEVIIWDEQGIIISPENVKELNLRHAHLDRIKH